MIQEPPTAPSSDLCTAIAFVGTTLAPFFLEDPRIGNAGAAFAAMAALNTTAAGAEWPLVDTAVATAALESMAQGVQAKDQAETLATDYRQLFVGPAVKTAPPWGSVYTDRECVVFGESTLALRQWMREHAIARTTDERTPEDHIGLMLALMAHIARTDPALLSEYLRLHLLPWAAHFLDIMEQASRHPFYQGLAQLTRASLAGIQSELSIEVTYPHFYR